MFVHSFLSLLKRISVAAIIVFSFVFSYTAMTNRILSFIFIFSVKVYLNKNKTNIRHHHFQLWKYYCRTRWNTWDAKQQVVGHHKKTVRKNKRVWIHALAYNIYTHIHSLYVNNRLKIGNWKKCAFRCPS